jgi:hypothetical protein
VPSRLRHFRDARGGDDFVERHSCPCIAFEFNAHVSDAPDKSTTSCSPAAPVPHLTKAADVTTLAASRIERFARFVPYFKHPTNTRVVLNRSA